MEWLFTLCIILAAFFPAALFGWLIEKYLNHRGDLRTFQSGIVRKTNFED